MRGGIRAERVERRGVWLQQQSRHGWWEFGNDKAPPPLINVVNENETNWTHFHLITHPAQVKRSEVLRNKPATSKPVGLLLLIDTSKEGK